MLWVFGIFLFFFWLFEIIIFVLGWENKYFIVIFKWFWRDKDGLFLNNFVFSIRMYGEW